MSHRHVYKLVQTEIECDVCLTPDYFIAGIAQCECGEVLQQVQIERRLNATEALSAEDAMDASVYTPGYKGVIVMRIFDALVAYARILEGSNE